MKPVFGRTLIAILLTASLALALTGCGSKPDDETTTKSNATDTGTTTSNGTKPSSNTSGAKLKAPPLPPP